MSDYIAHCGQPVVGEQPDQPDQDRQNRAKEEGAPEKREQIEQCAPAVGDQRAEHRCKADNQDRLLHHAGLQRLAQRQHQ